MGDVAAKSLTQKRYQLLVQQLLDEQPRSHGAGTTVADMLDIHQSYISQLTSGARGAGRESIDKAVKRLGLDPSFFHDAPGTSPHYRDYLRKTLERPSSHVERETARYASFETWLGTSRLAQQLQAGEVLGADGDAAVVEKLRRQPWNDGDPGEEVYDPLARSLIAKARGKSVKKRQS